MPRIQVAEQAGVAVDGTERPSEDRVVVLEHAVLLLDGATSLRPGMPAGGWYAAHLAAEVEHRLRADPAGDLADLLAASIGALRHEHGLEPGSSPSSTVALLRWNDDALDALVLADSPIVVFGRSGPGVLADERLATLPRGSGGYRQGLRSGSGFGAAHAAALSSGATATGAWRNVDGGFWVAEAEPCAAYQAIRGRWQLSEVDSVLMSSDGVSCAVDDYGLWSWQEMRDLAGTQGPQAVLDAVRAAERSDPNGERWPRPKLHDDQALVLLTDW